MITHLFETPYDSKQKTVRVLLPKDYDQSDKAYPVLYMHDGQNLFHNNESYANSAWKVQKAIAGEDLILVGLNHSEDRIQEYIPFKKPFIKNKENYGDRYMDWLVNELKPFIDQHYRTSSGREHTYIAGSSLGGLISAYALSRYNEIFSVAGIFSLAIMYYEQDMAKLIEAHPFDKDTRVFLQVGTHEVINWKKKKLRRKASQDYLNSNLNYVKRLLTSGIQPEHLDLSIDVDAKHHEQAWRKAFPRFVEFIRQSD